MIGSQNIRNQNGCKAPGPQIASEGGLSDWVCRIQDAWAREASNVLELAHFIRRARFALPRGEWTRLWQSREIKMPFSKRTGEMLVAIAVGVEGLNAQNSARLPAAWNTLYFLALLGRKRIERLISEGIIHPGLSLQEARELLAKYHPEGRQENSRSKSEVRTVRFAKYVQNNLETWSQQERRSVAEILESLVEEIRAAILDMDCMQQAARGTRKSTQFNSSAIVRSTL